ncbi:MAG: bifunctional hydroxymethylpyrimidine kinase/phosphomethylpyrimidine kinase [Mariprofundus sp.]|nr:bifunctional hydroxymethylpyrimidine kinase/phosphomethylpyrimidine kinase [Mariprofundus sp.]
MSKTADKQSVCLTIGGSDSCGGAGIQADLSVFHDFGVHGCSAITALTAQNPIEIRRIEPVPLVQLDAELQTLFDYYDVAVVKTGMLVDVEHIAVVSALLQGLHHGALIVDPVMVASSGTRLLGESGVDTVVKSLLPMATLVTPNLHEAAFFLAEEITDPLAAVTLLADRLECAVLLKGGHADGELLVDLLCDEYGVISEFSHAKQLWSVSKTHGTGCRLASAIAAAMAQKQPLAQAVGTAINYLQKRN